MKGSMKRTLVLLSLSVLSAPPAFAAQWKHLGSDGKSTHYFYNPKTFSVKSNVASAWTKKELNVDPAVMAKNNLLPNEYKGSKSIVAFEEFNCTDRKKRTMVGKIYEAKTEGDVERTDWTVIEPGSVDEGLLNALCKGEGVEKKEGSKAP